MGHITKYSSYLLILFVLAVLTIQPSIDPDLGWHLRYGEYFFKTGHVLKDNILSTVWPHYKWVQASWGFDLLVYQVFLHGGFFALSLVASGISVCIFVLLTIPVKRIPPMSYGILAIIFVLQTAPLWGGSLRSQTPSTLFFALVIIISDRILNRLDYPSKPKTLLYFIVPLLFFLWANMHGGFSLGLILMGIMWILYGVLFLIKRFKSHLAPILDFRTWVSYGISLAASVLTPLVNPWGFRIYEETFKHTTNSNLTTISEWRPLTDLRTESIVTACIIVIVLVLTITQKKLGRLPLIGILLVCAYATFSASRFIILLGCIEIYILSKIFQDSFWATKRSKIIGTVVLAALVSLVCFDMTKTRIFLVPPNANIVRFNWADFCYLTAYCEEEITMIMRENPPQGNGYHPYNYGGYLAWRVPKVKTFIDGRMAAWKERGSTPPVIEGDSVFIHQTPLVFNKFDQQYSFKWAIVPTHSVVNDYLDTLVRNGVWRKLYENQDLYSYFVKVQ